RHETRLCRPARAPAARVRVTSRNLRDRRADTPRRAERAMMKKAAVTASRRTSRSAVATGAVPKDDLHVLELGSGIMLDVFINVEGRLTAFVSVDGQLIAELRVAGYA